MSVVLEPVQPVPAAETLPLLKTFLSPYTGIVRTVVEHVRAPDEPTYVSYAGAMAQGAHVIGQSMAEYTTGMHVDRDCALAAVLAEAVERYSVTYIPKDQLVFAAACDLDGQTPSPGRFALFHRSQYAADAFPFVPFTASTPIHWIRGFSLPSGDEAFLPAQLVFLLANVHAVDEQMIGYPTSSGVACGATREEAILRGLLELVERDAFMIVWSNRLSLPTLDSRDDPRLASIDAGFSATGLRYGGVDLSGFFGIPTVLGVVHGTPGELGALGVGAACALTIQDAYHKALTEAFSVRTHVRDAVYENPGLIPSSPDAVNTFDDHIFFYGHQQRAPLAEFLDSSSVRRRTIDVPPLKRDNLKDQIEAVIALLAERDVSAYAVEVTSPDVRPTGLVVMRVICPELCPLDVVDRARFLGGTRLYRAAFEAGLAPGPLEFDDLNPYPHPFP